jgi:hypothetical protein
MTEKQILLVRQSWEQVAGQREKTAALFSKKLELVTGQRLPLKKVWPEAFYDIIVTLHHLVISLPEVHKAENTIMHLLQRCKREGMTAADYNNALVAFLLTLEKKLGRNWSPEVRDSWVFVLASTYHQLTRKLNPVFAG